MQNAVSVIIATTCAARRREQIRRAVASVLAQKSVPVELLLVVNGGAYDAPLLEELRRCSGLCVLYREPASYPAALKYGRQAVSTPLFAFLDDDDVYLPDALQLRVAALRDNPNCDFLASNGYVETATGRRLFLPDIGTVRADPLLALCRRNWLSSSGTLFRSAGVPQEFFDGVTRHSEWTWLAFQLLTAGKRCCFVDVPTFHNYDTPGSLSKDDTLDHLLAQVELVEKMLALAPPDNKPVLEDVQRYNWHSLAERLIRHGQLKQAWQYHWRSLASGRGWKHLPFTRRFLYALLLRRRFTDAPPPTDSETGL